MSILPAWVCNAERHPIGFAQVREDPRIDQWVIQQLPSAAQVLMIGSGGCTIASIAHSDNVSNVHVVDPNPSQLILGRLKLHLLQHFDTTERAAFLGHLPMDPLVRRSFLIQILGSLGISQDQLGVSSGDLENGLDYCGRYEAVFAEIRRKLLSVDGYDVLDVLLLKDPLMQQIWLETHPKFVAMLAEIFDEVLALENLCALFGDEATQNRFVDFASHFHQRIIWVLRNLPAASNPYLWQMLLARFPPKHNTPWLELPQRPTQITYKFEPVSIQHYLSKIDDKFDFIHLSNVLDWLPESEAEDLLQLAWQHLKPEGYTLVRQLNSSLDIRGLAPQFSWQENESERLHLEDRSFFYRELHLGQRV